MPYIGNMQYCRSFTIKDLAISPQQRSSQYTIALAPPWCYLEPAIIDKVASYTRDDEWTADRTLHIVMHVLIKYEDSLQTAAYVTEAIWDYDAQADFGKGRFELIKFRDT